MSDAAASTARDLIFLAPIFHGKIWGGRELEKRFGVDVSEEAMRGAISAHNELSRVIT